MMAALFFILGFAVIFAYAKMQKTSITILVIGMVLTILMFLHHATDSIKVNL